MGRVKIEIPIADLKNGSFKSDLKALNMNPNARFNRIINGCPRIRTSIALSLPSM